MAREKKPQTNTKDYNAAYYAERREELLRTKREKYASNTRYREAAKARGITRYWARGRNILDPVLPRVPVAEMEPVMTFPVTITDKEDVRYGKVIQVKGYTSRQVAEVLGRTLCALLGWEKKGLVPPPRYRAGEVEGSSRKKVRNSGSRVYTEDEVRVLEAALPLLSLPGAFRLGSVFSQKVHEEMGRMPQGVQFEPQ